jgi:hypothetical protein
MDSFRIPNLLRVRARGAHTKRGNSSSPAGMKNEEVRMKNQSEFGPFFILTSSFLISFVPDLVLTSSPE